MSRVTCHVSCVMCHVSHVTCHVSHVNKKKSDKVVKLSGGGSVINGAYLDPCEAAKLNSIEYFSTQDFGIDIQSSIFPDKKLTFLNDRVFFNTKFLNIKTIDYFSTQILNLQTMEYFSTLIFKYTTGQCQKIMNVLNCYSRQE